VHMLVLPNSSAEDADMFRMERVCDVTCQLRPGSGNPESARAIHAHTPQRRSASLLDALVGRSYCVSSSCVPSPPFPFHYLTVLRVE
jgi:hypothetical protein